MLETILSESQFDYIGEQDKQFILSFTKAMEQMGYTFGDTIGSGFCWGKHMLIFRRAGVKSKNVYARIYMSDGSIVLRLFFNNVTKHASFISAAPQHIKEVFTGDYGNCKHCKGNSCKFRKDYVIDGKAIEKCNGTTFTFFHPAFVHLLDYLSLFQEFYPKKKVLPNNP
ncbi:MAG: hypothetical protein DBY45_09925 [Clostridiales bacterium]|nr:MAG: hypothetical protein DBY45_09925 [Clostridiales bacterium]